MTLQRSCPCIRPCEQAEENAALMAEGEGFRFRRGELLWEEGDPASWLLVVCTGTVKLTRTRPDGPALILDLVGRDQLAGEGAARTRGRRFATCEALEDGRGRRLTRRALADLLLRHPERADLLLKTALDRGARFADRLQGMAWTPVDRRLAQVLHDLGTERGLADARGRFIPFRLTRRELAGMVGCREETVTRLMAAWQRQGLVETRREGMVLRKLEHLDAIARAA